MYIMTYPLGIRKVEDDTEFCQSGPLNQNFKWILRWDRVLISWRSRLNWLQKGRKYEKLE